MPLLPAQLSLRIHRGYRQSLGLQQEPRLEKTRHGVETYKFFQNWLRVPEPRSGLVFGLSGRDNALMGAGQKYGQNRKKQYQNALFPKSFFVKSSEKNYRISTDKSGQIALREKLVRGKLLVFMSGVSPAAEV